MNNYTIKDLRELISSDKFLYFMKHRKRKNKKDFLNRIKWK